MVISREVREGRVAQGEDERIAYTITTTPWGSTPTSVSAAVYDVTDSARVNVTATCFPVNTPTVSGDVITLPLLQALTAGHLYRVEAKFTLSGNVMECYLYVECAL